MKSRFGDMIVFTVFLAPAVTNWEEVLRRLISILH